MTLDNWREQLTSKGITHNEAVAMLKEASDQIDALRAENDRFQELLKESRQAISWYMGLCNGFENGETYGNHPDLDAYSYLKLEAWNIGELIDAALEATHD